jgi:hypothetical protein
VVLRFSTALFFEKRRGFVFRIAMWRVSCLGPWGVERSRWSLLFFLMRCEMRCGTEKRVGCSFCFIRYLVLFFFLRWCDDEAGVDLRRCGLYPSPSTFYLYVSLLCT